MNSNSETLLKKLQQLATGKGFIVFALEGFYVQFADENLENDIYFEAVSHHFVPAVPATLGSDFAMLGFQIEEENYYKKVSKNRLEAVVSEVEHIFKNLYQVDYDQPFSITDEIEEG